MAKDLLGRDLTASESQLLALYEQTKTLLRTGDDLPPGVRAHLRFSLAQLWQIVNDLDLGFEQLYDLGV